MDGSPRDRKSLLAVRGVGRESEAESVRFQGCTVTKVGPEGKHALWGRSAARTFAGVSKKNRLFPHHARLPEVRPAARTEWFRRGAANTLYLCVATNSLGEGNP